MTPTNRRHRHARWTVHDWISAAEDPNPDDATRERLAALTPDVVAILQASGARFAGSSRPGSALVELLDDGTLRLCQPTHATELRWPEEVPAEALPC